MSDRPGWDAIDAAVEKKYPHGKGLALRSMMPPQLDPHPCKMIGAWQADGPSHWHLISYGLSELFAKESDLKDQSGWGHELTMRVPRAPTDDGPPQWATGILRQLVKYTDATGKPFRVDHYVPLDGAFGPGSTLAGLTFTRDPGFEPLATPNGKLFFLQAIGITADELTATERVHDQRVVTALAKVDPMMLTVPSRKSVLAAAELPAVPPGGVVAPGSIALNELGFARSPMGWYELTLPRVEAQRLAGVLRDRLGKNLPFTIGAPGRRAILAPAKKAVWLEDGRDVKINVTPELLDELCKVLVAPPTDAAVELKTLRDLRLRF